MSEDRLRKAYRNHKGSAKHRGIPFMLSFEQWLSVWKDSGKLHPRGKGSGKWWSGPSVDLTTHKGNSSYEIDYVIPHLS